MATEIHIPPNLVTPLLPLYAESALRPGYGPLAVEVTQDGATVALVRSIGTLSSGERALWNALAWLADANGSSHLPDDLYGAVYHAADDEQCAILERVLGDLHNLDAA